MKCAKTEVVEKRGSLPGIYSKLNILELIFLIFLKTLKSFWKLFWKISNVQRHPIPNQIRPNQITKCKKPKVTTTTTTTIWSCPRSSMQKTKRQYLAFLRESACMVVNEIYTEDCGSSKCPSLSSIRQWPLWFRKPCHIDFKWRSLRT